MLDEGFVGNRGALLVAGHIAALCPRKCLNFALQVRKLLGAKEIRNCRDTVSEAGHWAPRKIRGRAKEVCFTLSRQVASLL